MDNKHALLFIIHHSQVCIFMLQMHRNTLGPLGGLMCSPRPLSRNGGLPPTSKRREVTGGEGPSSKGDGKDGERVTSKVQLSRIKH